ncbi:outer membrane beta-barrel protein [Persicobacter diffluens]|uniref:Outer membrane protein beta-barrel domain-containing protein n=1 Tax=Persicobacter diffluens TaxID=981 RepID=A0AAN5ANR0_9BACT|nr:hypothetical protein PEDI_41330 [Persicobacter diffluens]
MKPILLLISCLILSMSAWAQEEQNSVPQIENITNASITAGSLRLGMDLNLAIEPGSVDQFGFLMEINYFLFNNFAVGGEFVYRDTDFSNSTFKIGGNVRYYLMFTNALGLVGKASLGFAQNDPSGEEGTKNGLYFNLRPGVTYFISERVNIETTVSPTFSDFGLTFAWFIGK